MWRNWAGDQQCVPARVERPGTIDELRRAVESAASTGLSVRAAGAGHSFTDIALTNGVMVCAGARSTACSTPTPRAGLGQASRPGSRSTS